MWMFGSDYAREPARGCANFTLRVVKSNLDADRPLSAELVDELNVVTADFRWSEADR